MNDIPDFAVGIERPNRRHEGVYFGFSFHHRVFVPAFTGVAAGWESGARFDLGDPLEDWRDDLRDNGVAVSVDFRACHADG